MAVLISAVEIQKLQSSMGQVKSVGQALAAVRETVKMANAVSADIRQTFFEDSWRTQARKDITDYIGNLEREAKALVGDATLPAGKAWDAVKPKVAMLWNYARIVQGQFPPDETTTAERLAGKVRDAASALVYGIENAPGVLIAAAADDTRAKLASVKKSAKHVKAAVKEVSDTASAMAGAVLGPIKWWLIGAGVLIVGGTVAYFVIAKKVSGV